MSSHTDKGMALRSGTMGDAGAVASLHAAQISEGFLAILGPRFLRRLYRRVVRASDSFLLVVDDETTGIVGFVAGSVDVAGLYRSFILRDGVPAALACAWPLVRSWRRVLETLRHGSSSHAEGAELLSVAVHPAARGQGVGMLLVEGFLAEVGRHGQRAAHVVVGADNRIAISLYGRAGFRSSERFELHSGTESLLMQWSAPGIPSTT